MFIKIIRGKQQLYFIVQTIIFNTKKILKANQHNVRNLLDITYFSFHTILTFPTLNVMIILVLCGYGGIGRRARFRF